MSKQAFDKVMSQLPEEDKKNIYAVAAAYGLDFDSPEWIPFAVSQHGLVAIQRAIVELGAAIKEGSDYAIAEAMKALAEAKAAEMETLLEAAAASQALIREAAEKARQGIEGVAVKAQSELVRGIASSVEHQAGEIIARQVSNLQEAQQALADSVKTAEGRINRLRQVGMMQVLGWALVGGLFGGGAAIASAHFWPGQARDTTPLTSDQVKQIEAGKDFIQVLPQLDKGTRDKLIRIIENNRK